MTGNSRRGQRHRISSRAPGTPPTPVPPIATLNSVTVLGDSLMANGNQTLSGGIGGTFSNSHVGWCNDLAKVAGVGLDVINLRAVGGKTIQRINSEQLPSALTDATAIAWTHSGVNSFNDTITTPDGGPFTLAQNITAMQSQISQLAAVKTVVIVDAIQPISQTGTTGARPRWAELPQFNASIQAYCATFNNVIFNDLYSVLVDSSSPTKDPLPNFIRTDDGIHYTTLGAQLCGYASWNNVISPRLTLTKYKTAGASLIATFGTTTGGTATPGSGTVTGTANIPAGWNVQIASGTSACAVSQPSAGVVRLTITNGGGAASTVNLQITASVGLAALVASGDVVQAGFDFSVVGSPVGLTRIAGTIRLNGATLWQAMNRDSTNEPDAVAKFPTSTFTGRRGGYPFTLPAATYTNVEKIISINTNPGGSAVVDLSAPFFTKLT